MSDRKSVRAELERKRIQLAQMRQERERRSRMIQDENASPLNLDNPDRLEDADAVVHALGLSASLSRASTAPSNVSSMEQSLRPSAQSPDVGSTISQQTTTSQYQQQQQQQQQQSSASLTESLISQPQSSTPKTAVPLQVVRVNQINIAPKERVYYTKSTQTPTAATAAAAAAAAAAASGQKLCDPRAPQGEGAKQQDSYYGKQSTTDAIPPALQPNLWPAGVNQLEWDDDIPGSKERRRRRRRRKEISSIGFQMKNGSFGLACVRLIQVASILSTCSTTFVRAQAALEGGNLEQSCSDCRLVAESLDEMLRRPRQMDAYGQLSARFDLDQVKKLVCKDISSDAARERCRNFYFSQQASVLKWKEALALAPKNKIISFNDLACIRELKLCCPSGSFGPKCTKCPKCGPNERCVGESTRSGNGNCACRPGHAGADCNSCQRGFYRDSQKGEKATAQALCRPCHRSCRYCRAPGPEGCEVCQKGFTWQAGFGCLDVDECIQSGNKICGPNTFCVNTEGAHFCYECDRACHGCHGDGPDMCLRCAPGYRLDSGGNCAASRKTILPPEANYYRYAIYAGLCVCICIILHKSVYLASLVGLGVALYIGASEYVMSGHPSAPQHEHQGLNNLAHLGL